MKKMILTFILLAFLALVLLAQNPVTNTVQAGPAKAKEVLVIFEVELKGLTPKPIQEGVLTDALTAEFAEGGNYNLVDRDTLYYYFKQIQEETHKPCSGPECLADLAAELDADQFVKAEVSNAGEKCIFSAKLYKRKPKTVLYFVDQSKIENCLCQADDLQKAAHLLGKKLTGQDLKKKEIGGIEQDRPETIKENAPSGFQGGPEIYIPAGIFTMGGYDGESNEKPPHQVYLNAYYINQYEVTVENYAKCVKAGKCSDYHLTGMEWRGQSFIESKYCNWGKTNKGNNPINCVDWSQAKAFCEWTGGRLPAEAEWEKAARGTEGRKYPWGNQTATCEYAVMSQGIHGCGQDSTWAVGSKVKGASPYGVMDMAGNVWEWIQDWYEAGYYTQSPSENPRGPSTGVDHVLRGGSWDSVPLDFLRTAFRNWLNPEVRYNYVGFRCARDAK